MFLGVFEIGVGPSSSHPMGPMTAAADFMEACIERRPIREGELPGGLRVKRRAASIRAQLERERGTDLAQPHLASDWLSVNALAVDEENAAGPC